MQSAVRICATLMLAGIFLIGGVSELFAQAQLARDLREEAGDIQAELSEVFERTDELQQVAESLEEAIAELDDEIEQAEAEIERINRSIARLQVELDAAQEELEFQQGLLRANMRMLYKRGGASTLELLASSDSFSEFIDEQEYLERLKASIQDTTRTVYRLRQEITYQRDEQRELLIQQEQIHLSLQEARQQREELLDETIDESERLREYGQALIQRQQEISRELLRMSHVIPTDGNGGYPWSNARCAYTDERSGLCLHPSDSLLHYEWYVGDNENNRRDDWGYFYRNCTSYVAWRSAQFGYALDLDGPDRRSLGHGGAWADNAERYDELRVSDEPKVGSFAIFNIGGFGHVAFVEEVVGSRVRISEYNFAPLGGGEYSERWIPRYQPTAYVHTPATRN